jgi:hypothetical protein
LIRHSLRYVPRRERERVARDLKPIYTALDADAAEAALHAFDEKWGKRFPVITQAWLNAWEQVIPRRYSSSRSTSETVFRTSTHPAYTENRRASTFLVMPVAADNWAMEMPGWSRMADRALSRLAPRGARVLLARGLRCDARGLRGPCRRPSCRAPRALPRDADTPRRPLGTASDVRGSHARFGGLAPIVHQAAGVDDLGVRWFV